VKDMDKNQILEKMKQMLLSLGFIERKIGINTCYVMGNTYCMPTYIGGGIGFLIEYAHSEEEAKKNWYGDGEAFPLEIGEEAILAGIRAELHDSILELR